MYLAKEAGLLYGAVAMATDYDCWRDAEDTVCASDVLKVFKQNVNKVTNIIVEAVELIGQEKWDHDINKLKVFLLFIIFLF